jgi:aryl-alcohol dehydrogenase-like predicted oxidoreductase
VTIFGLNFTPVFFHVQRKVFGGKLHNVHDLGSYVGDEVSRAIVHRAFDLGITHFDLANNYGSPAGASEELFGRLVKDLPRHEVVVST